MCMCIYSLCENIWGKPCSFDFVNLEICGKFKLFIFTPKIFTYLKKQRIVFLSKKYLRNLSDDKYNHSLRKFQART